MRRILSAVLAALLLLVAAVPATAYQLEDICPNLDGYQPPIPHGYKLVITEDAGGNLILECVKNGQH